MTNQEQLCELDERNVASRDIAGYQLCDACAIVALNLQTAERKRVVNFLLDGDGGFDFKIWRLKTDGGFDA